MNGNGKGNGASRQSIVTEKLVLEEAAVIAEEPNAETPVAEWPAIQEKDLAVEEVDEAKPIAESELPVLDEPSFAEGEIVELSPDALDPIKNGKISFFPWEQVEQFTRRIEKSKVERKDVRTIRALMAVSHWLEPKDQNPMTHAKCGIRALTDYPPTTEPIYVVPSDVMQIHHAR